MNETIRNIWGKKERNKYEREREHMLELVTALIFLGNILDILDNMG